MDGLPPARGRSEGGRDGSAAALPCEDSVEEVPTSTMSGTRTRRSFEKQDSWPRSLQHSMDAFSRSPSSKRHDSHGFGGRTHQAGSLPETISSFQRPEACSRSTPTMAEAAQPLLATKEEDFRYSDKNEGNGYLQSTDDKLEAVHLKPPQASSFLQATFNGINVLAGVGILSTPYATAQSGWLGLGVLLFFAPCFYETVLSVIHDFEHTQTSWGGSLPPYLLFLYSELYCVAVEYLILEGDNLSHVFPDIRLDLGFVQLPPHQSFILVSALVFLPTGPQPPSLHFCGWCWGHIARGVCSGLGWCCGWRGFSHRGSLLHWTGMPMAIGLFGFCFSGHAVFPSIYSSMKEPQRFTQVLLLSFLIVTALYGASAVMGYMMFGDKLHSQITLDLPIHLAASKLAIWTTIVSPFAKYGLTLSPVALGMEELLPQWLEGKPLWLSVTLMRTVLVATTVFCAVAFPFFDSVMAFIGSLLCMCISVIFPCLFYLIIYEGSLHTQDTARCYLFIILARTTQASRSDYYLHELPSSVMYKEVLASARFLKAVLAVHDEGLVVAKVYFKRSGEPLDLRVYERRLAEIRDLLLGVPQSHVWPFQCWLETDKAAYLLRQYFHSNLRDRLSTRPFLSAVEKKWLAFQLLIAIQQCHARSVCHGDIKCENVVVTSWSWAYFADFASFKPTYLPLDNPSDYSFFFDTGGRRRCYVAPERFYDPALQSTPPVEAPLEPAMDIFSLGCTMAELFLEDQALFNLSQLLAYQSGQYDPRDDVEKIEDSSIQSLIVHMIQLDPADRLTAAAYLEMWAPKIFPSYFPFLHDFFSSLPPPRGTCQSTQSKRSLPPVALGFTHLRNQLELNIAATQEAIPNICAVLSGQEPAASQHPEVGIDLSSKLQEKLSPNEPALKPEAVEGLAGSFRHLLAEAQHSPVRGQTKSQLVPKRTSIDAKTPQVRPSKCVLFEEEGEATEAGTFVTEEAFEYQARGREAIFVDSPAPDASSSTGGVNSKLRSDVHLPPDGMWSWSSPWQLAPLDKGGSWCYCTDSHGAGPWMDGHTAESKWRRRRCLRRRSRKEGSTASSADSNAATGPAMAGTGGGDMVVEGMVLIAALLCACLRGARPAFARRAGVELLCGAVAARCPPPARLQRVVPSLVALLPDPAPPVRLAALMGLASVLAGLPGPLPAGDARLFPEYIFPALSLLPVDLEESLRAACATALASLAASSRRLAPLEPQGAAELGQTQEAVARTVQGLATGIRGTPAVRCALLRQVTALCRFFGRRGTADFLLPLLSTFLNNRDAATRAAFFAWAALPLARTIGPTGLEAFLLPLLEQSLGAGEEPAVIAAGLACLASLASASASSSAMDNEDAQSPRPGATNKLKLPSKLAAPPKSQPGPLLRRRALLQAVEKAAPLLCFPTPWVRRGAAALAAAAARALSPVDAHALLAPLLVPFLLRRPSSLASEAALLAALQAPMARQEFDLALSTALLGGPASSSSPLPSSAVGALASKSTAAGQEGRPHTRAAPRFSSMEREQGPGNCEKLRAMESYIRGSSGVMQARLRGWEEAAAITNGSRRGSVAAARDTAGHLEAPVYLLQSSHQGLGQLVSSASTMAGPTGRGSGTEWSWSLSSARLAPAAVHHSSLWASQQLHRSIGLQQVAVAPLAGVGASAAALKEHTMAEEEAAASDVRNDEGVPAEASGSKDGLRPAADKEAAEPATRRAGAGNVLEVAVAKDAGGGAWQPRGVLVAHLQEHGGPVCQVAAADGCPFFVSASIDGTVRVWDCRRLERDVCFRSRLTYTGFVGEPGVAVACVDMLGDHEVAAAGGQGEVHTFHVDYVPRQAGNAEKYVGLSDVRRVASAEDGAVLALQAIAGASATSLLLYSTARGGMHLLDLRQRRLAWALRQRPAHGLLTAVVADPAQSGAWLVSATSRGILALWDLRFQIPVHAWRHPLGLPVEALAPLKTAHGRPLVYAAAGCHEAALWSAEDGSCQLVLRVESDPKANAQVPAALLEPQPGAAAPTLASIYSRSSSAPFFSGHGIEQLNNPPARQPGFRAMLPIAGGNRVLTGGTDCCIRLWDGARVDSTYWVCGPMRQGHKNMAPGCMLQTISGVTVMQEPFLNSGSGVSALAAAAVDRAGCHRDAVLTLATAQVSQKLLISGSRDGAIKVWR
eukprot:SM000006S19536  [mRNA]  locus=s6:1491579:1504808:+ [translate_table: standard]